MDEAVKQLWHFCEAGLFDNCEIIYVYDGKIKNFVNAMLTQDQITGEVADFLEVKTKYEILDYFNKNLDVILSDMAANTTGSKSLDSIRTNQLCADVINFSRNILKPKGVLVAKLFMGEDFEEVKNLAKSLFKKVNFFKPKSSKKESKETYLHCEFLKTL